MKAKPIVRTAVKPPSVVSKPNGVGNIVTTNMGKTINTTPSSNHSTVTKNPGLKGKPNSSVDIVDVNGKIKTRRWFDSNGKQVRDVDFTNHGNARTHPEVPHVHGPRQP